MLYSHGNFQVCDTVLLAMVTALYISSLKRTHLIIESSHPAARVLPGPGATCQGRRGNGQNGWRAPTPLWGPAAGAWVAAEAGGRHSRSGEGQGQLQVRWPLRRPWLSGCTFVAAVRAWHGSKGWGCGPRMQAHGWGASCRGAQRCRSVTGDRADPQAAAGPRAVGVHSFGCRLSPRVRSSRGQLLESDWWPAGAQLEGLVPSMGRAVKFN